MALRDNEPSVLSREPASDRAPTNADAGDSPGEGEYEEFVSRLTPWWILILSIAPTLFFLLRAGGADLLSYIVPVVSGAAAVIQYATQKPIRLIVAVHGLHYEHRSTRRVVYWADVYEVVVDKSSGRLILRVSAQVPFQITLKSFPDPRRLKDLILSYVAQEARVIKKPAVGSPLFPAVIVWVLSGFAVLVVALSPLAEALTYSTLGVVIGAFAGFAYVRVVRPTRKARFWTNLACLVFLLVAIAFGIWVAATDPTLRSLRVIIHVLCLVVGLATGFALTVTVVLAPEGKARGIQHAR